MYSHVLCIICVWLCVYLLSSHLAEEKTVVKTAAVTQTSSQSLPPLDFRQTQALHLAKRYCQDVTIKAVSGDDDLVYS